VEGDSAEEQGEAAEEPAQAQGQGKASPPGKRKVKVLATSHSHFPSATGPDRLWWRCRDAIRAECCCFCPEAVLSILFVGLQADWTPELHRRFVQAVEQLG